MANRALMRDHSLHWLPAMEQKARRLQNKVSRPLRMQIQSHLMRHAWCDTGQGSGKAGLQAAMQMTTEHPLNLRMAGNDRLKCLRMA